MAQGAYVCALERTWQTASRLDGLGGRELPAELPPPLDPLAPTGVTGANWASKHRNNPSILAASLPLATRSSN